MVQWWQITLQQNRTNQASQHDLTPQKQYYQSSVMMNKQRDLSH